MAAKTNVLELRWRTLNADYLDFVIDGQSLIENLSLSRDRVGLLGASFPNALSEAIYLRGLLLDHPSYLETGRYEIYVCPLCGDIGCGSNTAEIETEGDRVVWRDFAIEVDYWFDDSSEVFQKRYQTGPFEFDLNQYRQALLAWPVGRPHPMPARLKGWLFGL
jgi:hypothetical protein